jgi:UDP-glucose 4-epimerase
LRAAICNFGSSQGVSNRDVLDMVAPVTGQPVPLDQQSARQADVPQIVLGSSQAHAERGRHPDPHAGQ